MLSHGCSVSPGVVPSPEQPCAVGGIIPSLQMRQPRLREHKDLFQATWFPEADPDTEVCAVSRKPKGFGNIWPNLSLCPPLPAPHVWMRKSRPGTPVALFSPVLLPVFSSHLVRSHFLLPVTSLTTPLQGHCWFYVRWLLLHIPPLASG